ncbi:MAG: hypothetical protein NZ869_03305 [Thermoanaerobaculum sp.]|nr:hypothetical protein [Thermoanaerobaculum sp.]MDW7967278.1 hypothetical protein [Thermoanaerobaculum sp.]
MLRNADLAEALFRLADSYPAGDMKLAFVRAAYAILDEPRELAKTRRLPAGIPFEVLPTVTFLTRCAGEDALAAAVARLAGPLRGQRGVASRTGFFSAAEVARAGVEPLARQLRGAVHFHTRFSDGASPLETMAAALRRRGYFWAVITDHTQGLSCVNGLDAQALRIQRRAIDRWNDRHGDELELVPGVEAEILEDGSLDLPRSLRTGLVVVAGLHTGLTSTRDQTARLLRALHEPGVWALAHPKGRLFARRPGIRANWEKVFATAASNGVLVELNGFPRRQDLDPGLAALARELGCRFVVGSDAHHPRHLVFDRWALVVAQAAGIPPEAIVNFRQLRDAVEVETLSRT